MKIKLLKLKPRITYDLTSFKEKMADIRECVAMRNHRRLWKRHKLWITDDYLGVQNYPNRIFYPHIVGEKIQPKLRLKLDIPL